MLDDLLKTLKGHLSAYEYKTYMQALRFDTHASRADLAVFCAPNIWLCNYIKTRYGALLEQILSAKQGCAIKVQILPPQAQPKAPQSPSSKPIKTPP
ncbi:hypothetical protein [Helicobacter gastrocanis]|uniref:hypothetical protein n=1 Tax=Helicobacter gastrocanis TaxID=2849641 RepID=UPI0021A7AB59|nr:hypothetical protein [Helicobacter sp. NHP19-003]